MGFLAISMEPDRSLVIATAQRHNIGAKVAIARSEMLGPLAVNQVPSTAFLRPDGILNAVVSGPKDAAWFERRVLELLPQ